MVAWGDEWKDRISCSQANGIAISLLVKLEEC